MSIENNDLPSVEDNTLLGNRTSNSSGNSDKIVARLALIIATISLLFGPNLVGRIYDFLQKHPLERIDSASLPEAIIAVLNVILAAFVLLATKSERGSINNASIPEAATRSFKQLKYGWNYLWFTWILLYIWLAANWFGLHNVLGHKMIWYVADGLNMVNGFFFYYLFFVLDMPSVEPKLKVETELKTDRAKVFRRNVIIVLILGLSAFAASAIADWAYSGGAKTYIGDTLVRKLVGGYTAIGMAFFFGRLDSHLLQIDRVILAPLYLYVIIQLLWGSIEGTEKSTFVERLTILLLALILKFVVYRTFSRQMRDGHMLRYLIDIEAAWGQRMARTA